MKNKKNKILLFFIGLFLLLGFPLSIEAHGSGEESFLTINGEAVSVNPYFHPSITSLTIPSDIAPETYVVGQPLTFVISLPVFAEDTSLSASLLDDVLFRWSTATGENFESLNTKYHVGLTTTYSFEKSGSYLIIVEAKSPLDDDYQVIDTVKIDVLPSSPYVLPSAVVLIGKPANPLKSASLFVSESKTDRSTQIVSSLWDFADEKLIKGMSVEEEFVDMQPSTTRILYHRVMDSNGIIADVSFAAEHYQGTLHFVPYNDVNNVSIRVMSYSQAKALAEQQPHIPFFFWIWSLFIGGGIILIVVFSLIIIKHRLHQK